MQPTPAQLGPFAYRGRVVAGRITSVFTLLQVHACEREEIKKKRPGGRQPASRYPQGIGSTPFSRIGSFMDSLYKLVHLHLVCE